MDRERWGRIGGAVAGALTVAAVASWLGDLLVPVSYPGRSAYRVPGLAEPVVDLASLQRSWPSGMGDPGSRPRLIGYMRAIDRVTLPKPAVAAAAPQPVRDLGTLLAASNAASGERTGKLCASCHTFDRGGQNRTGPNLWGVVGRDIASAGFAYSGAMTGQPGNWTYESLDHFLTSPAKAVPGTKMTFAGIRNPVDRANLLAWLGTLNAAPAPFPKALAQANAPLAASAQ